MKTIHASLLLTTVDLPARAILSNMKQYNGAFSCSVCEDEGQATGLQRHWPHQESTMRTESSVINCAKQASETGTAVRERT